MSYQEKQNVLRVEIGQTGDYFLTDGESENIGDQTVEDSVEAISEDVYKRQVLLHLKVLLWEHVPVTLILLSWNSLLRKRTLTLQV